MTRRKKPRDSSRGLAKVYPDIVGPVGPGPVVTVARPLAGPPEDLGLAEAGMMSAIAIRVAQLIALARLAPADRKHHEVLTRATDPARLAPAQLRAPDLPREAHLARVAVELAQSLTFGGRLVAYAREYDADDSDERTADDVRLFLLRLAEALAAWASGPPS
jgi:hypothetical protein